MADFYRIRCILFTFANGLLVVVQGEGCLNENISSLNNLRDRAPSSIYVVGDDGVSDFDIQAGWYRTRTISHQYIIPDRYSTQFQYGMCGTLNPIVLRESHPDISTLTSTPVEVETCLHDEVYPCDIVYTVKIRKCGSEVQYYLVSTRLFSGYCFVPMELNDTTTVPITTTGHITSIESKPSTLETSSTSMPTHISTGLPQLTTSSAIVISSTETSTHVIKDSGGAISLDNNTTIVIICATIGVVLVVAAILIGILIKRQNSLKRRIQDEKMARLSQSTISTGVCDRPEVRYIRAVSTPNSKTTHNVGSTATNPDSDGIGNITTYIGNEFDRGDGSEYATIDGACVAYATINGSFDTEVDNYYLNPSY